MNYLLILLAIAALTGCQCPTKIQYVDRNILVTIPCKTPSIDKPVMPLTDTGAISDDVFTKTKKAVSELDQRRAYEEKLEAAVKACQ